MSATADQREAHAVRQMRAAEDAFDALDGRTRRAISSRKCEPVEEIRPNDWQQNDSLDDHAHLASDEPLPGVEPLSDPVEHRIQSDAVQQTLAFIIPALCEGFDRGPALGRAVLAVLRGEHRDESVRAIARGHGTNAQTLRQMLVGVRHLI